MDCRTCQPSLIDLLHGELALEAAEQARAHIAHCANCKGALDKLARGLQHAQQLPLVDPPQAVTARLLQLAEEQARRSAALRKPRGAPTVWQALLDFIGRFAAARQVGMVTIMLLIVAVGLWSLPQLKHTPVAAGGTVVHPDESGEAAPSTGVEPAQPLDLKVDLRAGRIRSRDDLAMAPAAAQPAVPVAEAEPAFQGAPVAERAVRARSAAAADKDQELARAGGGLASARRATSERKPAAPSPAPFPRNTAAKGAESRTRELDALLDGALGDASSNTATERRVMPAASAAPAPPAKPGAGGDLRATGRAEGVSAGPPAKKSKASGEAAQSRSALDGARATAASRGCDAALPEYDRIVRAAPASADAGEALIAMARCAQARGDAPRARTLLTRAARIPQVAGRASDMLERVPQAAKAEAEAAPAELPSGAKP